MTTDAAPRPIVELRQYLATAADGDERSPTMPDPSTCGPDPMTTDAHRVAEYLRQLADEESEAHTPRYVFIPVMLRHAAELVERIAQERAAADPQRKEPHHA